MKQRVTTETGHSMMEQLSWALTNHNELLAEPPLLQSLLNLACVGKQATNELKFTVCNQLISLTSVQKKNGKESFERVGNGK